MSRRYPDHTPKISDMLWECVEEWKVAPGKVVDPKWHEIESPPHNAEVTVTFQVPPARISGTTSFLRGQIKDGKGSEIESVLPSDLDLVHTAAENANLLHQLKCIGDITTHVFTARPQKEREALDMIREIVSIALGDHKGGSGAKILERMQLQADAVAEKQVDVAAGLLKRLEI